MGDGPQQVQHACESALAVLAAAMPSSAVAGSRAQWAAAVGAAQQVINVAGAVQDAAIARLAAIEPEWLEDGTEVESHRALGHLALDAPAIVSGVLNVAAVHAERRTTSAVHRAADGPAGTSTQSGLGGLHAAMTAGVLDCYRAQVVAEELAYAPAQVAASVVTALAPYFGTEDGALLRRRCRRVLARISPDLLRQRAKRARSRCGLRRWAEEPGVDRWEGTFPSEDAARAWAAIDALAQRYVRDGVCAVIEQARGKALTDLVTSNATIEAVITLTVPATLTAPGSDDQARGEVPELADVDHSTSEPDATDRAATDAAAVVGAGDLVEVTGLAGNQPVLVPRGWVAATITAQRATDPGKVSTAPCHRVTGALTDPETPTGADPAPATAGPDHGRADSGQAPAAAINGAGADRYRPSQRLVHRVKARDRRCRFPGCTVAAVFCDLDHVRPWPTGPTTMTNLVCLCRRHHRIKQRPGWRTTLAPDGTLTWTDPTGTTRTTAPVDALHPTVLPDTTPNTVAAPPDPTTRTGAAPPPTPSATSGATSGARAILADAPHSDLEFTHEHRTADLPWTTTTAWHDHRGHHRIELTPTPHLLQHDPPEHHGRTHRPRPGHRPRCRTDHEPPPF